MLSLIWAAIIGLIVGLIAKLFVGGPRGFLTTILIGVAGSVVATEIGQISGWYAAGEASGFIGDIIGAMIVLFLLRGLDRQRVR